jgi:hypothetical protein
MSRTITLEIPESEARTLEAAIDEALAALRSLESEGENERQDRIDRLRAETHVLMDQIRAELHVEETI